jgi:hypothetical protein
MLPSLDTRGFLPAGIHIATFAEVENRFAMDTHRAHLLAEFRRFVADHLIGCASGLQLYLSGSYFSDKLVPGDIDCTVELPIADLAGRVTVVQLQNDGRNGPLQKGWIWDQYCVDYWVTLTGMAGPRNFIDFFQYVGVKSASMKSLSATDKRGIVRVDQWILG